MRAVCSCSDVEGIAWRSCLRGRALVFVFFKVCRSVQLATGFAPVVLFARARPQRSHPPLFLWKNT